MHLLSVNGKEKYTVLAEHPDPKTWKNFILCFGTVDVDIAVRSMCRFEDCRILNDRSILIGDSHVDAHQIIVLNDSRSLMTYPEYPIICGESCKCIRLESEEGKQYAYSLWYNNISMGKTCLRSKNADCNIDLLLYDVDYINFPVGSDQVGAIVATEKSDLLFINNRLGGDVQMDRVHVFDFGGERRYIVGKISGFYKNEYLDIEIMGR